MVCGRFKAPLQRAVRKAVSTNDANFSSVLLNRRTQPLRLIKRNKNFAAESLF